MKLFFLALGLSMDAFAVAVGLGLSLRKARLLEAVVVGLYFGIFQAIMPVIGFFAGMFFTKYVGEFSHWISFGLLAFLGGKMIFDSFSNKNDEDNSNAFSLSPHIMIPFAIATSIDAMAAGVTFAVMNVNLLFAVILIGTITFAVSAAGVRIGNIFGAKYKNKAAFVGGIILIAIGLNILLGAF
jgi:putative Mn2+ efflux pump MntP